MAAAAAPPAFSLEIRFDKAGAVFFAGDTVTGVVAVACASSTSHNGVTMVIDGTLSLQHSARAGGAFEALAPLVNPVNMLSLSIVLVPKGTLPSGETEIPFSFVISPTTPGVPLYETYLGVHMGCSYTAIATAAFTFRSVNSPKAQLNVSCPGQSHPTPQQLADDRGLDFSLSSNNVKVRRLQGTSVPKFDIVGRIDRYYNDIDTPMSGFINVVACDTPISSLEIQLVRAEYAGTNDANAVKDATEVQNIQVGDGDVLRNFVIPLHMMFPHWFTCPAILTPHLRVEFEVNMVVVLEGCNQVMTNIPLRLYRGHRSAAAAVA